jgi:hypothetical protein
VGGVAGGGDGGVAGVRCFQSLWRGSVVGLRVRFVPAGYAKGLHCLPGGGGLARGRAGHVARCPAFSLLLTAIAGVRLSPY